MKGHRFDWRVKRRPPFSTFIDLGINGYASGHRPQLRMCRHPATMRRCAFVGPGDPLHYWWTKRGNRRFYRYHQRRMFGPDVPMV